VDFSRRQEADPAEGPVAGTGRSLNLILQRIDALPSLPSVANAILDGADCVMLSEETAVGKHPVRVVSYIEEIAASAEAYYLERIQGPFAPKKEKNPAKYLAYAACLLADNAESKALVCHSSSGRTARLVSTRRPSKPIIALTPDPVVMRDLNFVWGVHPQLVDTTIENHTARAEQFVQNSPKFQPGDNVIITSGQATPGQGDISTNEVKLYCK